MGRPNLVRGHRTIASAILSLCLTQKGECPLHPDFGLAPELFEPMSNYAPQYFIHSVRDEILKWLDGYLDYLSVDTDESKDHNNKIEVFITYRPVGYADAHTLVYPFYGYIGPSFNDGMDSFMSQVSLDGQLFPRFVI